MPSIELNVVDTTIHSVKRGGDCLGRKTVVNRITSDEKTKLINKSNLRLKDEFLMYLRSVQRSPGTIAGYDNDLLIVFTYMLDNLDNKDFQKLTKRDLIGLQNWLISNGNSSSRIRRIKSAISSLSNYCENILADDDPDFTGYRSIVRKIENPPLQVVREKTVWEESELEELLDTLVDRELYEKACFVALAMYGGRRRAEIARFKVTDFSDDKLVCDGALYKSAPILTKGNKYLECYTLAKKFKPYLDKWLETRTKLGIESEWLFPNKSDYSKHIGVSTMNSWANTFSNITGKNFYAHSLRHFFVSALSKAGIPDNVVVQIIGWSSSEMFNVYNDNSKDEQISQYFSNGEISIPEKKKLNEL